jgi:Zn-dependent protease with chaperone function
VDFFARQEAARRQSRWLLIAYALAVLCVIAGIDVIATLVFAAMADADGERASSLAIVVWSSLLVGGFIVAASTYKTLALRGGGGVVAHDLGGVRVDPGTRDPVRRRLINVVEEMAIAAGVPVPEVYVLERETSINALSAGYGPADAAIAVTAGMLKRLNREQLQAVIAHEFSHILNGDMRLSMRLMGLNFGLLALAMTGRLLLHVTRGGAGRKGKGGALVLIALGVMVVGYLGQIAGRLLQAMISRRREHLADASAVQFTRNPEGLKAALVRAAAQKPSARLNTAEAEEVAHMLFLASGRRLFATHPQPIERLQALEPGYRKERLREEIVALQIAWDSEPRGEVQEKAPATPTVPGGVVGDALGGGVVGALSTAAIVASVAEPADEHVARARELRATLPQRLQELAGAPGPARALVLALLLAEDAEARQSQLALIAAQGGGADLAVAVAQVTELAALLAPAQRLPVVLQLFPALRQLPAAEQRELIELIAKLSAADRRIDVFEFALGKLVACSLGEVLRPQAAPHGRATLEEREAQIATLFAVLAREGAGSTAEAQRAYAVGIGRALGSRWPDYDCPLVWAPALDAALDELRELQPAAKEPLLEGLIATVSHDGQVRPAEADLLRAVSAVLQCPLPPLLPA